MKKIKKSMSLLIWITILCLSVLTSCSDVDEKKNPLNPGDDDPDGDPFNFNYKLIKTIDNVYDARNVACSDNYIFTTEPFSRKVTKFDYNGAVIDSTNLELNTDSICIYSNKLYIIYDSDKVIVLNFNLETEDTIQINDGYSSHTGIFVNDKHFYFTMNDRVVKCSNNGSFIGEFGSHGSGDAQFDQPEGIIVGLDGKIYVGDSNNNSMKVFNASFTFLYKKQVVRRPNGQLENVDNLAIDKNDNIFIGIGDNEFHAPFYVIKNNGKEGYGVIDDDENFYVDSIAVSPSGKVVVLDWDYEHKIKIYTP